MTALLFVAFIHLSFGEVVEGNDAHNPHTSLTKSPDLSRCETIYKTFKCDQQIAHFPNVDRSVFLDCSVKEEKALYCARAGLKATITSWVTTEIASYAVGAVGGTAAAITVAGVVLPVLAYSGFKKDAECSADRHNKELITFTIQPLVDRDLYNTNMKNMSCIQLGSWTEQTKKRIYGIIAEKKERQARYDRYVASGGSEKNAERLHPITARKLTAQENEFIKRDESMKAGAKTYGQYLKQLMEGAPCLSPNYLASVACGMVGAAIGAGAAVMNTEQLLAPAIRNAAKDAVKEVGNEIMNKTN